MKKISLTLGLIWAITGCVFAQIENPVKWNYTAKKVSDQTYEIQMVATIEPKWHVYAQEAGEGPEPTAFSFAKNPLIKFEGAVKEEGKLIKEYDANFNSVLMFYANKVSFIQKVKLRSAAATVVSGTVTYMVCNDKKCLPPRNIPFSVKITGK